MVVDVSSCLFEVPQLRALVVALAVTHDREYELNIYIIITIIMVVDVRLDCWIDLQSVE